MFGLHTWLTARGLGPALSLVLAKAILVLAVGALSILGYALAKKSIVSIVHKIAARTRMRWDKIVFNDSLLARLAHFLPALFVYLAAPAIFPHANLASLIVRRAALVYLIATTIFSVDALLASLNELYETSAASKSRPIKGYIQVAEIFVYIIGAVLVVATIIGRSVVGILGGIGALTAVLLLVFRDSLLGLVASVQLTRNRMVQIGDWVDIPKYNTSGVVLEINLQTIKIKNFDNTVTSLPSYALISESFKNWQEMFRAGGRKIQRAVNIDIHSIRFCTPQMIEHLRKNYLLSEELERELQMGEGMRDGGADGAKPQAMGLRKVTNVGAFRAYVAEYLKRNPKIRGDMYFVVRELPPNEYGLPVEIYVFSSDTAWADYEALQADIFDHLLAIVPEFGLAVYQNPSGRDVRRLARFLRGTITR